MMEPALFDVDTPARVTEDQVQTIWELIPLPDHTDMDRQCKAEFLRLTNEQGVDAAVDYLWNIYMRDIGEHPAGTADRIREWLNHPEALPPRHPVPTLEDCERLADTDTEAGRALAWLLGTWPTGHPHEATPAGFGDVGSAEPGATSFSFDRHGVNLYKVTDTWPYTENMRHNFTAPVSREQMVQQARWLLREAREDGT